MFVMARAVWLAMLGALAAIPAAKLWGAAPKMQLYTNNISPGPDNVVGDFTAPTYTGYADQAVALSGPFTNGAGGCFELVGDLTFAVTTTGETTSIVGFIIKDSVAGYLGGVKFDNPVVISGPTGAGVFGQSVTIDPTQLLGPADID